LRILVNYGRDKEVVPGSEDQPMGGIRAAALGLCGALSRRGHDVHLFAPCPSPGSRDGVTFHDRGELAAFASTVNVDVLVIIPDILPLLMPVRARARVVWTGNAFDKGDAALTMPWIWAPELGKKGTVARLYCMDILHPYADDIVVGSEWQAWNQHMRAGIPIEKFSVHHLGVLLHHFRGEQPERHRHRLVYTSQARRGLRVLLQLFPQIRAEVPEAELHVFGYEYANAEIPEIAGAREPGVYFRGRVGKGELARELRSAAVMAYPTKFPETFCLSIAEAQAAGLPVVTSDLAALRERVEPGVDGFLIRGWPREAAYEKAFIEAVVRLLHDDELWRRMGEEAVTRARRDYDWDRIAAAWEDMLFMMVAGREPTLPQGPSIDLFAPESLTIRAKTESASVPGDVAARWLADRWASYGYLASPFDAVQSSHGSPSSGV
jgi:glycosyltransferase involved in cell wall biosynthesis